MHCQPAGGGQKVLEYLGRYVFRIAISNSRIEQIDNGQVTLVRSYGICSSSCRQQLDQARTLLSTALTTLPAPRLPFRRSPTQQLSIGPRDVARIATSGS